MKYPDQTTAKVSDIPKSNRGYGLFMGWRDDGYSDMLVTGVGVYVVRIAQNVVLSGGSYPVPCTVVCG